MSVFASPVCPVFSTPFSTPTSPGFISGSSIPRTDLLAYLKGDTVEIDSVDYLRDILSHTPDMATTLTIATNDTYYVDANATGEADGSSWADAFTTIQSGLNAATVSGDVVNVADGTYNEAPRTVTGGVTLQGYSGDRTAVIIDGVGLGVHTLRNNHSLSLKNLTVSNADANNSNVYVSATLLASNVLISNAYVGLRVAGTSSEVTLERVCVQNHSYAGIYFYSSVAASLVCNFSNILDSTRGVSIYDWAGSAKFNNCILAGNTNICFQTSSYTGAAVLTNCIQIGNGTDLLSEVIVHSGSGSLTITNCISFPNPYDVTDHLSGVTDGGNNLGLTEQSLQPIFTHSRYPVRLSFVIDDLSSLDFFEDFAELCEEFGWYGTFAVNTENATSAHWERMAVLVNRGHEIASHTVTHPYLDAITPTELAYELEQSKTDIEAGLLAAGVEYTVRSFCQTYASTNSDSQEAAQAAGYLGARGHTAATSAEASLTIADCGVYKIWGPGYQSLFDDGALRRDMSGLLEYLGAIGGAIASMGHDPDDIAGEITLAEYRELFEEIVKHPTAVVSTFGDMIEWLREYDPSDDLAVEDGGQTYTRTLIDESDYSLHPNSPLINAGTDPFTTGDGDQYDAAGNIVWNDTYDTPDGYWLHGVDIGAYSSVGSYGSGYHFEIVSGTALSDYVIKAPLAPELLAADDGTMFTAGVANEIDANDRNEMIGNQFWYSDTKGMAVYDSAQGEDAVTKIEKYFRFDEDEVLRYALASLNGDTVTIDETDYLRDISGLGNHVAIYGHTVTWGGTEYITLASDTTYSGNFSVIIRFNTTSLPEIKALVCGNNYDHVVAVNTSGNIYIRISGISKTITLSSAITTGTDIVATFSRVGSVVSYSDNRGSSGSIDMEDNSDFVIDRIATWGGTNMFLGTIPYIKTLNSSGVITNHWVIESFYESSQTAIYNVVGSVDATLSATVGVGGVWDGETLESYLAENGGEVSGSDILPNGAHSALTFNNVLDSPEDVFLIKLPEDADLITADSTEIFFTTGTAKKVDLSGVAENTGDKTINGDNAFFVYANALTGSSLTRVLTAAGVD